MDVKKLLLGTVAASGVMVLAAATEPAFLPVVTKAEAAVNVSGTSDGTTDILSDIATSSQGGRAMRAASGLGVFREVVMPSFRSASTAADTAGSGSTIDNNHSIDGPCPSSLGSTFSLWAF